MIRVSVDLNDDLISQLKENLAGLSGGAGAKVMPGTSRAFNMAAKLIQKSWQNWANGGSIEGISDIKNPNPRLASSIKIRKNSDFDVNIETDSRYMERIQTGTPGFDMKETYPFGAKSRVAQSGKNKGVPYLIIPFRWGTPNKQGGARAHFGNTIPFRWGTPNKQGGARAHFGNTIPLEVYKIMQSRKFKRSETNGGHHNEPNFKGENVERQEYDWGDRINDEDAGNANGMVKMKSNTGSTYFTFRIISAKSPEGSWLRKKIPPIDVVSAVEKTTRKDVEDILQAGLEQDLGI